jgi:hypothetical protein
VGAICRSLSDRLSRPAAPIARLTPGKAASSG